MHISAHRSVRTSAVSSVALLTVGAIFAATAPAYAVDDPARDAARTAAIVHKVTGVAQIATPRPAGGGSLTVEASGTRVDLPATGRGRLTVTDPTGTQIKIGLPGSDAAKAHTSAEGTVVYPQLTNGAVDVAAQVTTDGSASALITMKEAAAPTEYRFPLELPSGAVPIVGDDGGLVVFDETGELIGAFDAPWAKDANGKTVPTSYRLEGSELVQTIEVSESTTYPVVADPKWWDKVKSGAKKAGKATLAGAKKYGLKCAAGAWQGIKNPFLMTPQQKAAAAAAGCVVYVIKRG
ncbi:hypothetical protein [Streptomyces ficellus]|uniref:hypothetical protein n=1 Tax=Streptomyces ficellus TaxID=1977088 RepID=UPI00142F129B|nr:hypothetical protein [Streptomyces ficellus]